MMRPKVISPKVVLQGKVTKLKRGVKYFDETKEIRGAMLDFLNGSPSRAHQFQINGGLMSLKSHVDEVLEAMKCVSLKEDDKGDDKAEEEAEEQSEEEEAAEEAEEVGEDEEDDREDD